MSQDSGQLSAVSYQQGTRAGPTVVRTAPVRGRHPEEDTDCADETDWGGSSIATERRSRNDRGDEGNGLQDGASRAA